MLTSPPTKAMTSRITTVAAAAGVALTVLLRKAEGILGSGIRIPVVAKRMMVVEVVRGRTRVLRVVDPTCDVVVPTREGWVTPLLAALFSGRNRATL